MDGNLTDCLKKVSQLLQVPPKRTYIHTSKIAVKLEENCLKPDKVSVILRYVVDTFIFYELDIWLRDLNPDFILKDCLSGTVKLTTNADPDKYYYTEFGIGSAFRSLFFNSRF